MNLFEDCDKFIKEEIVRRSQRGNVLQSEIPLGINTVEEFMCHPLIYGLDFVTAHSAWEEYRKRLR